MLIHLQAFFAPLPKHNFVFYEKLIGTFLVVCAFLGLLQALPRPFRKWIIGFFTFIAGLYYAVEFFWPATGSPSKNWLTNSQSVMASITAVVGAFAIGLGVMSLLQLHTQIIARRKDGWGNSVVLIISFAAMLVFGLLNEYTPRMVVLKTLHQYYPSAPVLGTMTAHDVFNFLFNGGLVNLGAAMFSIIAFYIASASYRAFRIRTIESSLLMFAALIVMLGAVPLGVALTQWIPDGDNVSANFRIEHIAQWLLLQVNTPAQRGIIFGLVVGELAVALRLWLSLERGAYFDQEL